MRASNLEVRKWLLKNKYDSIWFKPHTKRNDLVFTQKGNYLATDLWNLFDGICISNDNRIIFLQMKTNSWAKEKPLVNFMENKVGTSIISFNVTNKLKECKGHYKVFVREYLPAQQGYLVL